MQLRPLGRTNIRISPIIMGTWQAGGTMWVGIEDATIEEALRAAHEAGINTFDTAELYGDGHSEQLIARALGPIRDKIVLATKVAPGHLRREQVLAACDGSLRRLATEVIDLYQIHWPAGSFGTPNVPIEETMSALLELQAQGKIRAIGVSNFSRAQLERALQVGRIEAIQPPYSLLWRQFERDALQLCQAHDISVLAYSPLAQGILAGRFAGLDDPRRALERGDHRRNNRLLAPELWPKVQAAIAQLSDVATELNIPLAHLALAWITAQPKTHAIAGARNAAQARANASAGEVVLDAATLARLDAISRTVTDSLDDDPVLWSGWD